MICYVDFFKVCAWFPIALVLAVFVSVSLAARQRPQKKMARGDFRRFLAPTNGQKLSPKGPGFPFRHFVRQQQTIVLKAFRHPTKVALMFFF